jgi:flavin-dependent dehydrogenase
MRHVSRVDAMVLGAGPAGLAFSIAAARAGMRVGLVARSRRVTVGEILTGSIGVPLHEIQVQSVLDDIGSLRSRATLSCWARDVVDESEAVFDPYGGAWFVDRHAFEARLLRCAIAAGVELLADSRHAVQWNEKAWQLEAAAVEAPLLVLANGRARCPIGNYDRSDDDRLVGLLAYDLALVDRDQAFCLEAVEAGWWYCAPLPGGRSVVALMTDADLLPRAGRVGLQRFWTDQLSRTELIRTRVHGCGATMPLVRQAGGSLKAQMAGTAWMAIGDAAASYDPLCGQGVATALSKGVAAARLIAGGLDFTVAARAYSEAEREAFADYQTLHRQTYRSGGERWGRSEFWRRRH